MIIWCFLFAEGHIEYLYKAPVALSSVVPRCFKSNLTTGLCLFDWWLFRATFNWVFSRVLFLAQFSFLSHLLPLCQSTHPFQQIFSFECYFNAIRYVGWRWTFLFLVYLYTILKNHTAHACEGDTLTIECPPRTSVTVLSAFYGRRVPHQYLCPSVNSNATAEEDAECVSPVAIEVSVKKRNCLLSALRSWCVLLRM